MSFRLLWKKCATESFPHKHGGFHVTKDKGGREVEGERGTFTRQRARASTDRDLKIVHLKIVHLQIYIIYRELIYR